MNRDTAYPGHDDVLRHIRNLPSLPATVHHVLDLLSRDATGASELAHALAADPGLTAAVLRMANSTFFGLSRQVTSLRDAVPVLGYRTVYALALAAAANRCIGITASEIELVRFWNRSIRVATLTREIAEAGDCEGEQAHSAGLLHDIGRLVLASLHGDRYRIATTARRTDPAAGLQQERQLVGTDHAEVGGYLAEAWNLPAGIVDAIARHHAGPPNGGSRLAAAIELAERLVEPGDTTHEGLTSGAAYGLWSSAGVPIQSILPLVNRLRRYSAATSATGSRR